MVKIPKEEYARLKRAEKELELKEHLKRSLKDAEEGHIIKY